MPKFAGVATPAGMAGAAGVAMPTYFNPLPSECSDSINPIHDLGRSNNPLTDVLQTLELIETAFSSASANDQKNIQVVINAITMMHGTRTESGVNRLIVSTDLYNVCLIKL